MWLGRVSRAGGRMAASRNAKRLARFGFFGPAVAGTALLVLALAACAVGPDFAPPPAPPVGGYTPEGHLATTVSVDVAGGAAQKFVLGRDIPGEWWKVFRSKELDALIA